MDDPPPRPQICWSLGYLRIAPHPPWMRAFAAAALRRAGSATGQQLAMLLEGLADCEFVPSARQLDFILDLTKVGLCPFLGLGRGGQNVWQNHSPKSHPITAALRCTFECSL